MDNNPLGMLSIANHLSESDGNIYLNKKHKYLRPLINCGKYQMCPFEDQIRNLYMRHITMRTMIQQGLIYIQSNKINVVAELNF